MSNAAPFRDVGRNNPSPGVHVQLGGPNWVLLTVTTRDRHAWLASAEVQHALHQVWLEASAWLVSDYVLMPDHLHCLCAPRDLSFTIEQWIKYWKAEFRRRHRHSDWKFQSRGWHHRLRDGESYAEKWLYVQQNPVRHRLVTRIEDWPYKGRVHDIRWS
jgi:putative transposase